MSGFKTADDFSHHIEVDPTISIYDGRSSVKEEVQQWCDEYLGEFLQDFYWYQPPRCGLLVFSDDIEALTLFKLTWG